jgi:hypothetical protein
MLCCISQAGREVDLPEPDEQDRGSQAQTLCLESRWSSIYGAKKPGEMPGFVSNVTCENLENVSGKSFESVEAVATFFDANGTPFTSESSLIDYDPLLPGQRSPFSIMARYNPAMETCRVDFKEFWGGAFKTDYSEVP